MPDDRLFHKRLGHSDKVGKLTDFEFIVWSAFVLSADDFGVLRFSAVTLQADHDRLAAKSAKSVQRALEQVAAVGLLQTFVHQGRVYGFQCDWQDWQHVEYPRATIHPAPTPDALVNCSDTTRKLFDQHPGGWRGKKRSLQADPPKPSEGIAEGIPKVSDTPNRKPLAVSRKPLAVSHQPVSDASDANSARIVFRSERFVVFEWQFTELGRILGPHLNAFQLDVFLDSLSRESIAAGLVIPKADVWPWLQAEVLAEAKRRGLPMAGTAPVRDKDAEIAAQNALVLAKIQQDRENRSRYAGR